MRTVSLSVSYRGRVALRDLTVSIGPGLTAVVGPNGSGKSTLLRALSTLVPPTSGRVEVFGDDLGRGRGAAAARRLLGFLPQSSGGLDGLRVRDALLYAAWLKGVPRHDRPDAVAQTVADLRLDPVTADRLGTLSGGTRQRALIAMTVVHRPRLVLLDEPTAGLDAEHSAGVRAVMVELARRCTVVLSTHLAQDVEIAAQVVALDGGGLSFHGTPRDLVQQASHQLDPLSPTAQAIERGLRTLGSS